MGHFSPSSPPSTQPHGCRSRRERRVASKARSFPFSRDFLSRTRKNSPIIHHSAHVRVVVIGHIGSILLIVKIADAYAFCADSPVLSSEHDPARRPQSIDFVQDVSRRARRRVSQTPRPNGSVILSETSTIVPSVPDRVVRPRIGCRSNLYVRSSSSRSQARLADKSLGACKAGGIRVSLL